MQRRVRVAAASNAAVGIAGILALVIAMMGDDEQQPPVPSATTEVVARAGSFAAPEVVVRPGDVVVFHNRDTQDHSFTAESGLFDSGVLAPGDEYRWSAGGARVVPFHCEIHPGMQATLVVTDA